ncbi:unnamed protein product [Prunus armeniaca]
MPYGMSHSSTRLSLATPTAQLEPLFSFGIMPPLHYTQHTTGPPPVTTEAPTLPPVPHARYTHPPRHFDTDVIGHIKPTAPTFDGRGDPTMFLDWV